MNKVARNAKKIYLHENDLPNWVNLNSEQVSIDTETMGLLYTRDRLCLIQLTFDSEICHLVQIQPDSAHTKAPNLIKLLSSNIQKIFHFARFDVGILFTTFGIMPENIFCTKIASKLARTYTERHGLKTICNELLKIDISKKEQCSDWGKSKLSEEQKTYAASDVLFLAEIKNKLEQMLIRESKMDLASECFACLPCIVRLDCSGWSESLFSHI